MRESKTHMQGTILHNRYQCLTYADDTVLIERTKSELKQAVL